MNPRANRPAVEAVAGRLIVIGAINTDFVIQTDHLPAPGETVAGDGLQTFGGGKAANAAVAASRAGADVALIAAVGSDSAGQDALASLRADGVDTGAVAVLDGFPTGAALIVVDVRGQNQIALGPGANGGLTVQHVEMALKGALVGAAAVLVSTEIPFAAVAAAVSAATRAGVCCILNPAPVIDDLEQLLELRPLLTPNQIELADLAGRARRSQGNTMDTLTADDGMADNLHQLGGLTNVPIVVTLGEGGCALREPSGAIHRIAAPVISDVVDTTGAGDTFNGVLAARLAAGDDLTDAVGSAVIAASLSVTAVGARAGMPSADAIRGMAATIAARQDS